MNIKHEEIFTFDFKKELKEFEELTKIMSLKELEILLKRQEEYVKRLRWKLANKLKNARYYITLHDECALRDFEDISDFYTCEGCGLQEQCEKLRRYMDD